MGPLVLYSVFSQYATGGHSAMPDNPPPQTGVVPTRLLVLTRLPIVMHANIPVRDLQVVYRLAFLLLVIYSFLI
jgi:hypothetical protein